MYFYSLFFKTYYYYYFNTLKKIGGPFTVFAPTNDAFKMVPPEMMAKLMASPADMKKLLLGHVTSGVNTLPGLMIINGDLPSMDGGSNKIMTTGNSKIVILGQSLI